MNTQAQGFLIALIIYNENDEIIWRNITNNHVFRWTVELPSGNYVMQLTYIEDDEALEQFLENFELREIVPEHRQQITEIFEFDNRGDYSVDFSMQIRRIY